jgi:hypothetical protein
MLSETYEYFNIFNYNNLSMTEELNSSLGNSSKKKTKIKVLEGSSYSRSIDVTRDDINIRKDYLKEKMENPYWIPNVNRGTFSF